MLIPLLISLFHVCDGLLLVLNLPIKGFHSRLPARILELLIQADLLFQAFNLLLCEPDERVKFAH